MSELEGNWEKVLRNMEQLGEVVNDAAKLATHQNALVLEATIVKHFQNQDLGWVGFKNPSYKRWKEKNKLSNQILIATSTLMNSIAVQLSPDKMEAFVGILRLSRRKDGKESTLIGAVHEYGSKKRNIPKRPFLKPSFKEKEAEMRARYKRLIMEALQKVGK